MKLIKMTDYVLDQYEKRQDSIIFEENCFTYAKFLKQALELWMFVPCKFINSVWVAIEEPVHIFSDSIHKDASKMYQKQTYVKEYNDAKERCLFKGFILDKLNFLRNNTGKIHAHKNFLEDKTIEDLIKYDLELTPTAKKQFNI